MEDQDVLSAWEKGEIDGDDGEHYQPQPDEQAKVEAELREAFGEDLETLED